MGPLSVTESTERPSAPIDPDREGEGEGEGKGDEFISAAGRGARCVGEGDAASLACPSSCGVVGACIQTRCRLLPCVLLLLLVLLFVYLCHVLSAAPGMPGGP